MKRRKFIGVGLGAGAMLLGAGGGWLAYRIRTTPHPHLTSLAEVRAWLARFDVESLRSVGVWDPAQILNHCAQSLEYSLTGFPELKPRWFQATIGAAAFGVFNGLGGMHHNLGEPVPGSPSSDLDSDVGSAIARLHAALDAFEDPTHTLAPHFAYGELDRDEFGTAHAMHISEHFGELVAR